MGDGGPAALVIGIGNPLRGDDGVGAVLLEELAGELGEWSTAGAELRAVHQLTPELALVVAEASRVLFLDACLAGQTKEPWIEPLDAWAPGSGDRLQAPGPDSHALEPATLLALAHSLYGWRGEGALLRVPAFAFPHGPGLSAPLLQAIPEARRLVRRWLQG
jgi:hydrogenase maturation protease